jgi:hypothetical protein
MTVRFLLTTIDVSGTFILSGVVEYLIKSGSDFKEELIWASQ